jgi:hypothetical protein
VDIIKKLSSIISLSNENIQYKLASIKNRYPCLLIGEKIFPNKEKPTIQYVIKSKRDVVYEITIQELLNDPLLIEKFHPTQAVKIGCIAMGNILCNTPPKQRKEKCSQILNGLFGKKSCHNL